MIRIGAGRGSAREYVDDGVEANVKIATVMVSGGAIRNVICGLPCTARRGASALPLRCIRSVHRAQRARRPQPSAGDLRDSTVKQRVQPRMQVCAQLL